jgi:hypothetical protein
LFYFFYLFFYALCLFLSHILPPFKFEMEVAGIEPASRGWNEIGTTCLVRLLFPPL